MLSDVNDAELYLDALRAAVDRRNRAESERQTAQAQIAELVDKARDAGVSVDRIATVLDVTRQAVYLMMKRDWNPSRA